MTTYVALLRGINVGRAKRVAMADLRALVADLGFANVRTLLNSGNVVFSVSGAISVNACGERIERAMASTLGVRARVTVLSAAELAAAVRANPLRAIAADPARLLIAILSDPADRARLEPLAREAWAPEAFALGERAAYLWCPDGILASRFVKALDRVLGDAATSRNLATMEKLEALARV